MQLYPIFYRRYGVRRAAQLLNPPLPMLDKMELPRGSVYHYPGQGQFDIGPSSDEFIFRNIERPIYVSHIVENGDSRGNPVRQQKSVDSILRGWQSKNRRYRPMREIEVLNRDNITQGVFNYALISELYRYPRSIYADYYRWWNSHVAIWKNINHVSTITARQQFIPVNLPKILPSVSDFRRGSTMAMNQQLMKIFPTSEAMFLLEIWKWLGPDRSKSMISYVERANLQTVNLLIQESGRWTVINLGQLNSWRAATKEELEKDPNANQRGISPEMLQKYFLRFIMSVFESRTAPAFVDEGDEDESTQGEQNEVSALDIEPDEEFGSDDDDDDDDEGVVRTVRIDPELGGAKVSTTPVVFQDPRTGNILNNPDDEDDPLIREDGSEFAFDNQETQEKIEAELSKLDEIAAQATTDSKSPSSIQLKPEDKDYIQGIMSVCDRFADNGMMSAAEYKRYGNLAASYKSIPAPDGKGTLEDFIKIPREDIEIKESPSIPNIPTVIDKSMLKSSLLVFTEQYVTKVLPKNIAQMVMNLQYAGIAVTGYEVERQYDIMGTFDSFTVRINPVDGAPSTLRFKLPVVDKDGYFVANGVKYKLRMQRGDVPIRKIGPAKVALTSYYAKTFVSRSTKKANDYGEWISNIIMAKGLDIEDTTITNFSPANAFNNSFPAPRLFSALAMRFRKFTLTPRVAPPGMEGVSYNVDFDTRDRKKLYGEQAIATYEKDGFVIMGVNGNGQYLIIDKNDALYNGVNGQLQDMGTIETLIDVDASRAPVEFAELKVLGREIPIGILLAYEMGLENLMQGLGVQPERRVPAGQRVALEAHEYALVFADETIVLSRDNRQASMILAGFNAYHKAIRQYNSFEFDRRGVYMNILETMGPSQKYLREIDLMNNLFIDPITKELLVQMDEPTTFRGLLIRACEMLMVDQHPDELDSAFMRTKGYERMAGAVYSEIIRAVRGHEGMPGKSKKPIDLHPFAVWNNISQDPSKVQSVETNPIQELKEKSMMTTGGTGGRSARSMTKHTRVYHPNDMGVVSESTVDSSDVAINTYTSADPQFTSVYGISRRYKIGESGAAALLSSSALLSPGATHDDPKRVNFIGIQHGHGIACKGYTQAAVRTGYEQVVPHMTSDLYAASARKKGVVVSVNNVGIIVEYEDGERQGITLGRRYGNAAGLEIPHSIVTTLKAGDTFNPGQILAYNDGFFEKDILNPSNVVWKVGALVKTVLLESADTLEDSSVISRTVADMIETQVTKTRTIVLNFDQSIHRLVKVGQKVEAEDILCVIEDAITANTEIFDDESLETLRLLGSQVPQAKAKGVVERIEVYYNGELEDMSDSLRMLAMASDKNLAARARAVGQKPFTGSVNESFRVDGTPLMLDTLALKIYITSNVPAGVGDKGVFGNQLKTVFGKVMPNDIITESNQAVQAVFGAKSISNRIVHSPHLIGTTTVLLGEVGKRAVKAYRS